MVAKRYQFASSESSYQILVGGSKNTNFTYWSSVCEGELLSGVQYVKVSCWSSMCEGELLSGVQYVKVSCFLEFNV